MTNMSCFINSRIHNFDNSSLEQGRNYKRVTDLKTAEQDGTIVTPQCIKSEYTGTSSRFFLHSQLTCTKKNINRVSGSKDQKPDKLHNGVREGYKPSCSCVINNYLKIVKLKTIYT